MFRVPAPYEKDRSAPLDLLRTLAIVSVYLFHYSLYVLRHARGDAPGWLVFPSRIGWVGVDLFFVLSGYLISFHFFKRIVAGAPADVRGYFIRRIFKIWPSYYFVIAVYLLVPAAWRGAALTPLWQYLTFTQNYFFAVQQFGAFTATWSLCVEEQFYLLFPLFAVFLIKFGNFRRVAFFFGSLFVLVISARYWAWADHIRDRSTQSVGYEQAAIYSKYIYFMLHTHCDGLLVGIAIAALQCYRPEFYERCLRHTGIFLGMGLAIFVAWVKFRGDMYSSGAILFNYLIISVSFGCLVVAASGRSFLNRIPAVFGQIPARLSYAIYLTHIQVIFAAQTLFARKGMSPGSGAVFVLTAALVLLVSAVLYLVVEYPFLRIRDRILVRIENRNRVMFAEKLCR